MYFIVLYKNSNLKEREIAKDMEARAIFEKIYYLYIPRRKIIPVNGYYQSVNFDFQSFSLQGRDILDFGCGTGLFSLYAILIGEAKSVLSIDEFEGRGSSEKNFDRLQIILRKFKLTNRIHLVKANGMTYDFKDRQFDIIYFAYVCHHLFPKSDRDDRNAISSFFKKMKRLLKPRGSIIIREVMRRNITEHFPPRIKIFPVRWETKRNDMEWKGLLYKAGFTSVSTRFYVPYYLYYFPFKLILNNKVASYFLTSRYVLECK